MVENARGRTLSTFRLPGFGYWLATIEHMQGKGAVAREARRLLPPGGCVVITFPSVMVDKILDTLLALKL